MARTFCLIPIGVGGRAASIARPKRAFTLIEILCVVVILGMASAIIIPQISSRDDLRAVAAARQLMGDLLYAQSRSIALGRMHYVQFNVASGTYQVLDAVSPNNVITNPLTQQEYTVAIGTGPLANVSYRTINFDGAFVLVNRTTGAVITPADAGYDSIAHRIRIRFADLPNQQLPDGNYRLTLRAGAVVDSDGAAMANDFHYDFHVLSGDVNGDRVVNEQDLYLVWQNLSKPVAQQDMNGDLDGDGVLELIVFQIQHRVPGPNRGIYRIGRKLDAQGNVTDAHAVQVTDLDQQLLRDWSSY